MVPWLPPVALGTLLPFVPDRLGAGVPVHWPGSTPDGWMPGWLIALVCLIVAVLGAWATRAMRSGDTAQLFVSVGAAAAAALVAASLLLGSASGPHPMPLALPLALGFGIVPFLLTRDDRRERPAAPAADPVAKARRKGPSRRPVAETRPVA